MGAGRPSGSLTLPSPFRYRLWAKAAGSASNALDGDVPAAKSLEGGGDVACVSVPRGGSMRAAWDAPHVARHKPQRRRHMQLAVRGCCVARHQEVYPGHVARLRLGAEVGQQCDGAALKEAGAEG